MQLFEHWDPLRMPKGSIRAIVTLTLVGTLWALMLLDRAVTPLYASLILVVVGHYYGGGSKKTPAGAEGPKRRGPLGLPHGSIRVLLLVGFAVVGWALWKDGHLEGSAGSTHLTILLLVGALQVGWIVRGGLRLIGRGAATTPTRFIANVQGVLVIVAAAILAITSWLQQTEIADQNVALICAPIIGYYFGTRE